MKKMSLMALVFLLVIQSFIGPLMASANTVEADTLKQSFTFGEIEVKEAGAASIPWILTAGDEITEQTYTHNSGLKLENELSGTLSKGESAVGTYTITVDGLVIAVIFANQKQDATGVIEVTGVQEETVDEEDNTIQVQSIKAIGGSARQVVEISDVKMNFIELKVGDLSIKNSEDAYGIQLQENQEAKIFYSFDLNIETPYAKGSTFTFQLPQSILVFDESALEGTIEVPGEPPFEYKTNATGLVTVTYLDDVEPGEYKMTLDFAAKFGNFASNEELEQSLEIPIKGSDMISLNLTFLPSSSSEKMTKVGTVESKNGKKYINWTVWTNRAGKELKDAELNDGIGEGHILVPDSITVEKYKVGINGVIESSKVSSVENTFPIKFPEDGKFAYKVIYQTEVTRKAENAAETFTNNASLKNNESIAETAEGKVTITYGTPLAKVGPSGDKYRAGWEIQYNYLGASIEAEKAEITDTLEGAHKIDSDSIKVYEVVVNEEGKEASSTALPKSGYTVVFSEDGKKLVVKFANSAENGSVTKAFKVTYDTVSTEEFITTTSTVKNTVTSTNTDSSSNQYVKEGILPLGEGIFVKSRGPIDFSNKTITWKLEINAEKDLENFKVVDTFIEKDGNSYQSLLKTHEGTGQYVTITGYDDETTLTVLDARKGYTLEFMEKIPKGSKVTITYKTKFDILPDGTVYEQYGNKAVATWNGQTSTNNTITKDAVYKPGNTPTGNNGYKNGEFDHVTQTFNWNIAVNINKQDINGATVTDTVGAGHHIENLGSVSIRQLNLTNNDTGTPGVELSEDNYEISSSKIENRITGFTITFKDLDSNQNNQAYIITYQTKDSDDIIGQSEGSASMYTNTAVFKTDDNKTYTYNGKVDIKNANELISKTAQTNPNEETITWTVDINKSHSHLGEIKLTDKPSANQLLLKDTFEIRKYKINKNGSISYDGWKKVESEKVEFLTDGGFVLTLGNLTQTGYQVQYKTFFTGANNEQFSNQASINYTGSAIDSDLIEDGFSDKYVYNSSSGSISSSKGTIKLHKIGHNLVTGEKVNLAGVKFELYNKTGQYKLAEATSDANGHVEFEKVRYGKYIIREVAATTPAGYLTAKDLPFTMNEKTDTLIEDNENKVIEVANVKITHAVKLTKVDAQEKDKNGQPVTLKGAQFTLYKESGEIVTVKDEKGNDIELSKLTTDEKGEIIVSDLEPGKYYFKETKAPDHYVLDSNEEERKTAIFEIKKNQGEAVDVTKVNQRGTGKVVITKVDAVNNETLLDGVEFELSNKDGVTRKGTTDENGKVEFTDLPYGSYTLKETKAKEGYVLDTAEREVVLDSDTNGAVEQLTIKNNKIIRAFKLTKVNASNTDIVLQGAEFKLLYKKQKTDEYTEVIGKEQMTTDKDGVIYVENLDSGTYQLIEMKAPAGYRLDSTPISFVIEDDQIEVKQLVKKNERIPVVYPEKPSPENPDDSKPEEPNNPENPDDSNPKGPANPTDSGESVDVNDAVDSKNPESADKGNSSSEGKLNGVKDGKKLPQTGENYPIGKIVLGLLLILIGCILWKKKVPMNN